MKYLCFQVLHLSTKIWFHQNAARRVQFIFIGLPSVPLSSRVDISSQKMWKGEPETALIAAAMFTWCTESHFGYPKSLHGKWNEFRMNLWTHDEVLKVDFNLFLLPPLWHNNTRGANRQNKNFQRLILGPIVSDDCRTRLWARDLVISWENFLSHYAIMPWRFDIALIKYGSKHSSTYLRLRWWHKHSLNLSHRFWSVIQESRLKRAP